MRSRTQRASGHSGAGAGEDQGRAVCLATTISNTDPPGGSPIKKLDLLTRLLRWLSVLKNHATCVYPTASSPDLFTAWLSAT